ncbi:MAG: hypothetical protein Barrevirus2_1, partial [Barrevirus sp.]
CFVDPFCWPTPALSYDWRFVHHKIRMIEAGSANKIDQQNIFQNKGILFC